MSTEQPETTTPVESTEDGNVATPETTESTSDSDGEAGRHQAAEEPARPEDGSAT